MGETWPRGRRERENTNRNRNPTRLSAAVCCWVSIVLASIVVSIVVNNTYQHSLMPVRLSFCLTNSRLCWVLKIDAYLRLCGLMTNYECIILLGFNFLSPTTR